MIDFSKKTYENILRSQLDLIPDTIDKREGSIVKTALSPASWYMEGIYLDLAFFQNNVYADTAAGTYLDRLVSQVRLERKNATTAMKEGVFNIQIPIGSRFSILSNPQYVTYRVKEFVEKKADEFIYKMECETAGESGNNYSGQLIAIDYIPGLTSARLTNLLNAGSDEETDDDLRRRFLTKIQKPSTGGNRYDYYNWALECEGVGAVKVFPLGNGPGTVKVVIADINRSAAGADLVRQVQDHIEGVRPIGADVSVVSAQEKGMNISADIKLKNGLNLGTVQNLFSNAITEYLQENAFGVSYISLAKIGNLLLNTIGVDDFTNLLINGEAGNQELQDEEIAVPGNIVLEVI
ncbi:baseplate J/gp47 family protein [Clostridium sp. E02]|uniref:baseplate J/gp47 family protein n=1 Tax=Clostridium sp. E02 TaxID=2487134 RepID=UPI000F547B65|nr:baseplate J/gp47 family protein [Clostridium sp. E02]